MPTILRAAAIALATTYAWSASADDNGAPRQSRRQQLAQSCRTLCILEYEACNRTCDSAAVRIDCLAQCQTRLNVCTQLCR